MNSKIGWCKCDYCGRPMDPQQYSAGVIRYCNECTDERHAKNKADYDREYVTVTDGKYAVTRKK